LTTSLFLNTLWTTMMNTRTPDQRSRRRLANPWWS
jgi:hypothetical protein